MWLEILSVILLGVCFGSFNTLLAHRLPRGKAIGMTRSECPACHHLLGVRDLVPVFSWMFSSGRCRYCGTSVHWRYPLTELVTTAVFLLTYMLYGLTLQGGLIALLGSQIVVLCIVDLEYRIIPDGLQWGMGAIGLIYALCGFLHIADALLGALAGGIFGLALQRGYHLLKQRHGLGMGDVKFMVVAGLWLGFPPLVPFFFYAGVLGVVSALFWRLVSRDPYFPFGPALALSLLLLLLYPSSEAAFYLFPQWILITLGIIS